MTSESATLQRTKGLGGLVDPVVMNFDDLAYGSRFRYLDSERVWVKLHANGYGLIAEFDSEMIGHRKWIGQSLCAAKECEGESLTVIFDS